LNTLARQMLIQERMADKDKAEDEEKGGKSKILLIVLGVLGVIVVAGGSAAGAVALTLANAPAAAAEEEAEPVDEPRQMGPLMEIPAMVVNLDDPTGSHFIRAAFQFELADAEQQPQVESHLVPVRSEILLHLSGMSVEECMGRENRQALLDELLVLVNEQIGAEIVTNIYFTALVVQ